MEVERVAASVAHRRPWPEPALATAWFVEVDGPALVLGSTQADQVVDRARAASAGVEVVHRHSGGGAVLVRPGEVVWADVLVPAGDPRWQADVGLAFGWLGQAWVDALGALGVEADVHEGPLVANRWSPIACFAGLGPGEVTVEGRKMVGISQRRMRAGALFQCAALVEWDPSALVDLLAIDGDDEVQMRDDLATTAAGIGVDPRALTQSVVEALRER